MPARVINVAHDFSRYPAGRFENDGPYSGQAFRDQLLYPLLRSGETVTVELDGVRGYGSSFLEEAFGGLVRKGLSPQQVIDQLQLQSADGSLVEEITEYIQHGGEQGRDA